MGSGLNSFDILLIHDCPKLTSGAIEDIQRFLIQGGGLIWFTGDELEQVESLQWPSLLKLPELLQKVSLDGESFFSSTIVKRKNSLFADLDLVRRLKIVDLPTLGRPTIATTDIIIQKLVGHSFNRELLYSACSINYKKEISI